MTEKAFFFYDSKSEDLKRYIETILPYNVVYMDDKCHRPSIIPNGEPCLVIGKEIYKGENLINFILKNTNTILLLNDKN